MTSKLFLLLAAAIIPVLVLAVGSRDQQMAMPNSAMHDAIWTELMESMQAMHAAMGAAKPSGRDDLDFVDLMLPHHQAAVDMAKAELLHGSDPQMRRLAQEIVTDQQSEIQLMQLWLGRQPIQLQERQVPRSGKEP